MVTREDLRVLLTNLLRLAVDDSFFDGLGVVLDDVRQTLGSKHFFPQVRRHDAVWIRWVARAIFVALVERQEP